MKYLYAFIGAGPATLAAVSNLPRSIRERSIIVDQGRHKGRRICPELRSKSCSSCYGHNCHVTSGVGGASANFGNKFCNFPASEGVKELMVDPSRFAYSSDASAVRSTNVFEYPNTPNRKVYDVSIARMDAYAHHMNDLISSVLETTEIREEFDVERIAEARGAFSITSTDGCEIVASNVVIATGRSGHKAIRRWLKNLEVAFEENTPDIGVRIEVETATINKRFFYQDDPKFKYDFDGLGQGRTFCTCRGGMIVPVKFGAGFFADGAFAKKDTGRTNVALMARTHETHDPDSLEEWCHSTNSRSQDNLLHGEFALSGLTDRQLVENLLSLIPEGPTSKHKLVLSALADKLVNDERVGMFSGGMRNGTLRVYGPAIDRYWPRVELSRGFATRKRGLYVIGDAAGVSRGIVQAAAAGASWAATQCEQLDYIASA